MEKQEDNRDLIRLLFFDTFFFKLNTCRMRNEAKTASFFSKNFSFSYCRFRKNAYLCNRNRER